MATNFTYTSGAEFHSTTTYLTAQEGQIEVQITSRKGISKRLYTTYGSVKLSPCKAKELAKAISPDSFNVNMENAIAISGDFHTHPKYDAFYKIYNGGCVEIYSYIESMARALTTLENEQPDIWDQQIYGLDWIEFFERYVDYQITHTIEHGVTAGVEEGIKHLTKGKSHE